MTEVEFLEKLQYQRPSVSSYSTRNSQNLQIPKHRTERYKTSFHYSALKNGSNMPINIRELPTIQPSEATEIVHEEQDMNKHNPLEEQLYAK